jgi:hypothetical protein
MDAVEEHLEHYGIRGMKWGVRRTRAQIDADSADKATTRALGEKVKKNRGSTDSLSNQELQAVITRMNLEQQYANLTSKESNKNTQQRGAKWASEFTSSVANTQLRNAANKVVAYQVEQALIKKGALPEKKK